MLLMQWQPQVLTVMAWGSHEQAQVVIKLNVLAG